MFGLFKKLEIDHPLLGSLVWHHGYWQGEIEIVNLGIASLFLGGNREGPDSSSVDEAIEVNKNFEVIRPKLMQELIEHYEPYAEAIRDGKYEVDTPFPDVVDGADALGKAKLEAVSIVTLDGQIATELCFEVPWDEEHILGARFRGPQWVELCGSTVLP